MNDPSPSAHPSGWMKSLFWLAFAVASFHLAYTSIHFPAAGLFIFGYALGLVRLADQPTVRRAFYFGLVAGYLCAAPQLYFLWNIFGAVAIVLWAVIAFWIGFFTALVCGCVRRWGRAKTAWLIPIVWTGLEYFRSELYYLRFSWLNIGYALPAKLFNLSGVYGAGFLVFAAVALLLYWRTFALRRMAKIRMLALGVLALATVLFLRVSGRPPAGWPPLSIAGIQMEFPLADIVPRALDRVLKKNPDAQILVLSEYTLDGPVPEGLKTWCREHSRFLVVGGIDPITTNAYYNTAFVVGTNGGIVFQQAKSVPVQYFQDGRPAREQRVWDSPWGKIGICICYDLSYTRVTDRLVKEGAQLIIVPTADHEDWGRHEHELHFRIAPVRAAEYGLPIFRLASSGISQAVAGNGQILARTSFPGSLDILSAQLRLPPGGSLPFDRILAPACTSVTAVVLAVLLFVAARNRRAKKERR